MMCLYCQQMCHSTSKVATGSVIAIIQGLDGHVCVVKEQIGQNELTCAVHKIVPLECHVDW